MIWAMSNSKRNHKRHIRIWESVDYGRTATANKIESHIRFQKDSLNARRRGGELGNTRGGKTRL